VLSNDSRLQGKKMFGLEAVEASYVNGFFSSLRGKFYVLMYAVNKGFNAFNRTVVDGYAQPNEVLLFSFFFFCPNE